MNSYEEKKQRRIDYYNEKADKLEQESNRLSQESSKMIDAIPMGQPLLVDHYSYKSDKNYRDRAWGKMENPWKLVRKRTTIAVKRRPPRIIPLSPAMTPKRLRS